MQNYGKTFLEKIDDNTLYRLMNNPSVDWCKLLMDSWFVNDYMIKSIFAIKKRAMIAGYKGVKVRLFFIRFNNIKNWTILLTARTLGFGGQVAGVTNYVGNPYNIVTAKAVQFLRNNGRTVPQNRVAPAGTNFMGAVGQGVP